MGVGFGASSSSQKQSSTPQDLTPSAYTGLRPDIASMLQNLFTTGGPVYTGQADLNAGQPTVANPQYAALQGQVKNTPSTITTTTPGRSNSGDWAGGGKGGMGGGGGGPVTTTSANPAYGPLVSQLAGQSPTMANPNYAGQAPLVAPLTDQQNSLINQIVSSVQQPSALSQAGTDQLTSTIRGDYLRPESNPFLAAAVSASQKSLTDNFERNIVPQLLSRFTQAGQQTQGQGSSAFAHEGVNASNDLQQNLSNVATTLYGQNYGAERQNQLNAITQGNQITNDELTRMTNGLQAAALPQLVQDLGIQRGLAEFDRRMQVVLDALKTAGALSAPTVANASQGKGSSSSFNGSISL